MEKVIQYRDTHGFGHISMSMAHRHNKPLHREILQLLDMLNQYLF